ncbi:NAD(P)-binding domain-containing protein, partial [Chloroflexota bacterium]
MRIGFIGTGNMGKPMASHLLAAGYELTVHDKRKEATEELVGQGAQLGR